MSKFFPTPLIRKAAAWPVDLNRRYRPKPVFHAVEYGRERWGVEFQKDTFTPKITSNHIPVISKWDI